MWQGLLKRLLNRVLRDGTLAVRWPDGSRSRHGSGAPEIAVTLHDAATLRALVRQPEIALGEAYMDETLTIDDGDLHAFLDLVARNARAARYGRFRGRLPALARATKRLAQTHSRAAARRNVAHHYDLSPALYELFLDADMQYTCGYFPSDNMTLDAAQQAKKDHIAAKLLLEPGMRVLDIGCGWGGTAITLARDYGAQVVGVTLSQEQKTYAERRIADAGLTDRIEIRLTDYRDVAETFDRIVVVGMIEHVGQPQYDSFFQTMQRNLAPDGIALLHTIGRSTPPNTTAPWIGKYIFPGSHIPSLSELATATERAELVITDIEVWRLHYARTLRAWRARFEENRAEIEALTDARFIRMWRFYLTLTEVAFVHLANVVFQIQITRDQTAVPLTRDYLSTARP